MPSGTLDGLYSTRIGPSTQFAVALRSELGLQSTNRKAKKGDYPDDSHISFSLQHDRGKWGSELTYNAKNGMWGGQILYNFGRGAGEDKSETLALPTKRVDEDDAMNGGLKGRLSAGAEVLFSLRDKSGGSGLSRITTYRNSLTRRSYNCSAFYDRTRCDAAVCTVDAWCTSGVSSPAPNYHHCNPQPAPGAYPNSLRLPSFTGFGTLLAFQFQCLQLRERMVDGNGVVDTTAAERERPSSVARHDRRTTKSAGCTQS